MSRFVVTEVEGYMNDRPRTSGVGPPGLSVQVVDSAWGYKLIKMWRSEDYWNRHGSSKRIAREKAEAYALALNEGREPPKEVRRAGFRLTCPYCRQKLEPNVLVCPTCANTTVTKGGSYGGDCVYCGRATRRFSVNGKPCCRYCDDLPGKEAL